MSRYPASRIRRAVSSMSSSVILLLMTFLSLSVPASGAIETLLCPFINAAILALFDIRAERSNRKINTLHHEYLFCMGIIRKGRADQPDPSGHRQGLFYLGLEHSEILLFLRAYRSALPDRTCRTTDIRAWPPEDTYSKTRSQGS